MGPGAIGDRDPVARTRMGGVFGRGGQGVKEVEGIGFRKQNWGKKVGGQGVKEVEGIVLRKRVVCVKLNGELVRTLTPRLRV